MANIDKVQLPDASQYNIQDTTSGYASQTYVQEQIATINKNTIGLGNVDNTADLSKPVSTAQQTAIDTAVATKVNKTDVAPVEESSTASQTYQIGDQFYYNGLLYKATAVINSGGTITPNGNCTLSDTVTTQIKKVLEWKYLDETVGNNEIEIPSNAFEVMCVSWLSSTYCIFNFPTSVGDMNVVRQGFYTSASNNGTVLLKWVSNTRKANIQSFTFAGTDYISSAHTKWYIR